MSPSRIARSSLGRLATTSAIDDETAVRDARRRPHAERLVLGVIGGHGGVGASVVATGVAVTASSDARTLLLDLDPLGGGIDLLLGLERTPGQRWSDFVDARGALDPAQLHPTRHPGIEGLSVLSHARGGPAPTPAVVLAVLRAAVAAYDVVVCDLPRQVPDASVLAVLDHVVVVTGVDVRACAASSVLVQHLRGMHERTSCIVRGPGPAPHDPQRIAEFLDLPMLAQVLWEPRLDDDIEDGRAPGLRRRGQVAVGSRQVLDALLGRPAVRRGLLRSA